MTLIFKYYKMIRFDVTMKHHLMLGVLQIPLVERNKRFRLYQIYNLPLPLPEAKLQIEYDLNHKYLAITTDDQYITYPHETEILGCQLTAGAFCELNTALFQVIGVTSCEFSLYQQNLKQIRKAC